jgi:hypothetical protein
MPKSRQVSGVNYVIPPGGRRGLGYAMVVGLGAWGDSSIVNR